MKKKVILTGIILIMVSALGYGCTKGKSDDTAGTDTSAGNSPDVVAATTDDEFILEGYPLDLIPLYQVKKIDSMKFFVNDEPTNVSGYFDAKVNYYNVVFETRASQADTLSYYKSLMNSLNDSTDPFERYDPVTTVEGKIGEYKVRVAHYGYETAYIQAYVPAERFAKQNRFFTTYPGGIAIDPSWIEHENSYGDLNQNDGEIEYSGYFVVDSSSLPEAAKADPIGYFYELYAAANAGQQQFTNDRTDQELTWTNGEYHLSLNFSEDHGRVYLMIRKPMDT